MNWIFKNKKMPCEKSTSEFFCKLKNILYSKKTKTILVVLVLVCVFMMPLVNDFAQAANTTAPTSTQEPSTNKSNILAKYLIGMPLLGVQNLLVLLLTGATTILETMLNPDAMSGKSGLLNSQVVQDIWVMTRDTMNMFFILILLFSAFCTIFQVEKWNLKKVWLAILINALLVNFSFPIARFFIDISNVAMYYFLNNMFTGATSGTAATGSSIAASFGTYSNLSTIFTPTKFADDPIMYELAIIVFTFIFAMTILVLAILFVIRLIALGIIVMFSPIGFVGFIFPDTQKFASDWWSNLFKYAFFGPIMVFMMSVALQISSVISSKTYFDAGAVKNIPGSGGVDSKFIASIASFSIPIIVLWIGMGISKKMGIAGADMIVGKAQQFSKWVGALPFRGAWMGTKAAGRWADRKFLKSWSPRAILKGWEANAKAKEEAHLGGATGAWRDRFNGNKITGDGTTTHYKDMEEENLKAKELKEMEAYATNDEYLLSEIRSLQGKTDAKSQARVAAAVSMMFKNNDQNEFMKKMGITGKGGERDPIETRKALAQLFRNTGMNENQVGRNLYQLGEIALAKGNYADYGMGTFDKHTNTYRVADNKLRDEHTGKVLKRADGSDETTKDEQIIAAQAKFANIDSQGKIKTMHWNSILKENTDSSAGEVHDIGKEFLNNLTAAEAAQVNRARADFVQKLGAGAGLTALEKFVKSDECTNPEVVRILMKEIAKKLNGAEGGDQHSKQTLKEEKAEYDAEIEKAKEALKNMSKS